MFGKIIHNLDPEIRKLLVRACLGMLIPPSILEYDLPAIEIDILFQKMTM